MFVILSVSRSGAERRSDNDRVNRAVRGVNGILGVDRYEYDKPRVDIIRIKPGIYREDRRYGKPIGRGKTVKGVSRLYGIIKHS